MDRVANAVIVSWGLKRLAIALAAGATSALAMAPFHAFFVLWVTLPLLVWLIDGAVSAADGGVVRRIWPSFVIGWWFGFGYFVAGLWWIGSAFLVEARDFAWLMPLAVVGLPALLALFWGAGVAAARLVWGEGWQRIFALAVGLGLAEWLRGTLFGGFPWNALGEALAAGEVMMQSAALFGIKGLNVLAVAVFAAPAVIAGSGRVSKVLVPAAALLTVAGLAGFGMVRLADAPRDFVDDVDLRIVQPSVPQQEKWQAENKDNIFRSYLDLSKAPGQPPLSERSVLIWPESAFPFHLISEPGALRAIGDLLPAGATLVTGAARVEALPGEPRQVFNSIYVIADDGTITGAYDKVHLVPFGEYLPLQTFLEGIGLRQLTRLQGGFAAGKRRRLLNLPFAPPFAPLICYEIIFSGELLPPGPRPGFLLNVTNDAWFGRTPGPYQHFHQARIRAVEEGLPLVRAANTGISAVVDPYGRIVTKSDLDAKRALDARLPRGLPAHPYSLISRYGYVILLLVFIILAFTRYFNRILSN